MKNLGFIGLVIFAVFASAPAFAEIQFNTYLHCGDYNGPNPDLNLIRYTPDEDFRFPMWAFSYGVKTQRENAPRVREEVSCVIKNVSTVGSLITFSGDACDVQLSRNSDQTYAVTFENNAEILGCVFDIPLSQLLPDFTKDKNDFQL
jgi:hypothetical protein